MLMQRSASPQEFIAAWVRLIKRQNRSGRVLWLPHGESARPNRHRGRRRWQMQSRSLAADTIEALSGYLRAFYGEKGWHGKVCPGGRQADFSNIRGWRTRLAAHW
jgi:hypothetical protein